MVITAATEDGQKQASCTVTLKFQAQATRRSSSSGGSSSGGSSSSRSRGSLPSYVVTGRWIQNAAGKWLFTDNKRTYVNEWAAVHNPYADASKGQSTFDWFRFDQNGYMMTGWFSDASDGNTYYLHTISDGTQGRMYTGWNWIDDDGDGVAECYYFHPVSDGTRGRLYKNAKTPDGYQVNEKGQWMENGVVQKKQLQK